MAGTFFKTLCFELTIGSADEALLSACERGNIDPARQALDCGANLEVRNKYDETPILVACRFR